MPFDGSNFKRLVKQISSGEYYEPPDKPSSRFTFLPLSCSLLLLFTLVAFLRHFLSMSIAPERCQAASPLVRHMLLVDPAKRANVEDICSHWYVIAYYILVIRTMARLLFFCFGHFSGGSTKDTENRVWKSLKNWPTRRQSGSIYSCHSSRHQNLARRLSSAPNAINPHQL